MTPKHPLTKCALFQARYLADVWAAVTPAQQEAHKRLSVAIRAGDLPQTVEAVKAMKHTGSPARPMATPQWREWATSWLDKVDRLIVGVA